MLSITFKPEFTTLDDHSDFVELASLIDAQAPGAWLLACSGSNDDVVRISQLCHIELSITLNAQLEHALNASPIVKEWEAWHSHTCLECGDEVARIDISQIECESDSDHDFELCEHCLAAQANTEIFSVACVLQHNI